MITGLVIYWTMNTFQNITNLRKQIEIENRNLRQQIILLANLKMIKQQ